MLDSQPIHNSAATVETDREGIVKIAVVREQPWYLVPPISWIVPIRPERSTTLDRTGSYIWRLCDGKRTVEAIVDDFAEKYSLSFHESRVAVTGYLRSLIQRGILAVAIPDTG